MIRFLDVHVETFEREFRQVQAELVEVGARVDESGKGHVAADAGDAVEVGDPHDGGSPASDREGDDRRRTAIVSMR